MAEQFDLIAIGGGTAGLVTAAGATYLGARVALIERDRLGGDCLWTGCVPSKALIATARAAQARRDSGRLGLLGKARPVDFGEVMDSMRTAREIVSHHDDPARFRALGVTVVSGAAEFVTPTTVRVGDRVLTARRVVIATGSRPAMPPIPGLAESGYLTHQTVFDLVDAPRSIGIIGGGPIGVEFAQLFQRLGVPVVLFERLPRLLEREDPEAAGVVRARMEAEGVTMHLGAVVERVKSGPDGKVVEWRVGAGPAQRLTVDALLVAAGRAPNTEGLCLKRIGVSADGKEVSVDARLRTPVPGIWAAGDVTGGPQFTHVADYQARLVVRNALTPFRASADLRAIPRVTYSDPELAQVGPTEEEARTAGVAVRSWRYDFADLDRAITDRREDGFVKLLASRRGRLLGATIVGAGAGELVTFLTSAIQRGASLTEISAVVFPYPTMSEAILRAANLSRREALDSWGGRWLQRIVRWGL